MNRALAALLAFVLSSTAALAGAGPERDALKAYLGSRGADAGDVVARVEALSDDEARELAGQLDAAPAGGNIEAAIKGVFFLALVAVVLVVKAVESIVKAVQEETPAGAPVPTPESPFPR